MACILFFLRGFLFLMLPCIVLHPLTRIVADDIIAAAFYFVFSFYPLILGTSKEDAGKKQGPTAKGIEPLPYVDHAPSDREPDESLQPGQHSRDTVT